MAEQQQDGGQGGPAFGVMARPQTLPQALVAVMDAQDALEAAVAAQLAADGAYHDAASRTDLLTREAVARLVGTDNPLSGKTPAAAHSQTSAEKAAPTDDKLLADHLAGVRTMGRLRAACEAQASVARNRLRSLRLIAAALMLEPRVSGDVPFLAACGNDVARALLADTGDAPPLMDALEAAWGIIANASGGDWHAQSDDWQRAAERWRDGYHARLRAHVATYVDEPGQFARDLIEDAPDLQRVAGDVADDIVDDITDANREAPNRGE